MKTSFWLALLVSPIFFNFACTTSPVKLSDSLPESISSMSDRLPAAAVSEALPHFGYSDADVRKSFCRAPYLTAEQVMATLAELAKEDRRVDATIFGVKLKSEPESIVRSIELLLTFDQASFGPEPKGQADRIVKKISGCNKPLCIVEELFGKFEGPMMLYMLRKFGINHSVYAFPFGFSAINSKGNLVPFLGSQPMNWQHLSDFARAIHSLPNDLFPLEDGQSQKATRCKLAPDASGSVVADATISLFPLWDEESSDGRQSTVVHELGHNVGMRFALDNSPEWLALSGWIKNASNSYELTLPSKVVSKYAASNPNEDFAETVAAYRYHPDYLFKISPEKFHFMKELVFDNLDYRNPNSCGDDYIARTTKYISRVGQRNMDFDFSSAQDHRAVLKAAVLQCKQRVLRHMNFPSRKDLVECSKLGVAEFVLAKGVRSYGEFRYPSLAVARYSGNLISVQKMKATLPVGKLEKAGNQLADEILTIFKDGIRNSLLLSNTYYQRRDLLDDKAAYCKQFGVEAGPGGLRKIPEVAERIVGYFPKDNQSQPFFEQLCLRVNRDFAKIQQPGLKANDYVAAYEKWIAEVDGQ